MTGGFMASDDAECCRECFGDALSASGHRVIEEQPETLLGELLSLLPQIHRPYLYYRRLFYGSAPPEDNGQRRKQSGDSAAVHH
jgi:hypothetical protein